ncbi:hypothetical protein PBY51_014862 [Eleginops maclovinus]|uniref:Uncharacterized protein n=1 Tax=Eleginops maclovinus TaxID=56733 RepID=A0AAN7X370_ELEMC|nr:hypothetical protein PBY51_014862 [Eleginops maclovinus]
MEEISHLLWALTEFTHNGQCIEVRMIGRPLICTIIRSPSNLPFFQRSLGALLAQLHFVFAKNAPWHAALPLEQLLHQLLPSAAGPGRPQSSALTQAQGAQQPSVLQKC